MAGTAARLDVILPEAASAHEPCPPIAHSSSAGCRGEAGLCAADGGTSTPAASNHLSTIIPGDQRRWAGGRRVGAELLGHPCQKEGAPRGESRPSSVRPKPAFQRRAPARSRHPPRRPSGRQLVRRRSLTQIGSSTGNAPSATPARCGKGEGRRDGRSPQPLRAASEAVSIVSMPGCWGAGDARAMVGGPPFSRTNKAARSLLQ